MAKKTWTKGQKSPDNENEEIEEIENGEEADEDFGEAPPPEEVPDKGAENKEGAGEPVPPAGSHTITLKGDGSLSVMFDGEVLSLERGKKIKVPAALAEALAGETEEAGK